MTNIREVLAKNIKAYRSALGLTQANLAEKVNTSTHYIGMIENKKKFPTPEMLERIAAALEIDAPALFSTRAFRAKAAHKTGGRPMVKLQEQAMDDITQVISTLVRELGNGYPDNEKTNQ